MADHPAQPDPTPAAVPFTFAAGEERDALASIPEAQSHGGPYAVAEGRANTDMPDAPRVHGSEDIVSAAAAPNEIQHGTLLPTSSAPPAAETISTSIHPPSSAQTTFVSSYAPPTTHPQAPPPSIAPASKASSSITPAASQQPASSTSNPTGQETQDNQEEIVPIGQALEVDSSSDWDNDSAIGDDTFSYLCHPFPVLTTSISSSVTNYRHENGRRYHAHRDGVYYLPNDELEADRLDLQHHVWRMTLSGALYISPLPTTVSSVLDVGTGTGIWAIEFAEEHPAAQVVGTDLSPIQPTFVPPNCNFIVDDAESDWVFDKQFDFIHGRMLCLVVRDWTRFFRQCWDNLQPGGWVEIQEIRPPLKCDDGSLPPGAALHRWSDMIIESASKIGIDGRAAEGFSGKLRDQGFVNVREEKAMWAVGSWPRGKREKIIGQWTQENMLQGVQGISLALFTRRLGMSREAVELFLVDVRKDIKNPKAHMYCQMYIHSAQKPPEHESDFRAPDVVTA